MVKRRTQQALALTKTLHFSSGYCISLETAGEALRTDKMAHYIFGGVLLLIMTMILDSTACLKLGRVWQVVQYKTQNNIEHP